MQLKCVERGVSSLTVVEVDLVAFGREALGQTERVLEIVRLVVTSIVRDRRVHPQTKADGVHASIAEDVFDRACSVVTGGVFEDETAILLDLQ